MSDISFVFSVNQAAKKKTMDQLSKLFIHLILLSKMLENMEV
jgi:hypothetical protein